MAVRVGTDLVHIPRFAQATGRSTVLERAFTEQERSDCAGRPERLAGRWAVKEAVLKALGYGLDAVSMTEIEVSLEASGAPTLRLYGRAATLAAEIGCLAWAISLSHDGDYATAVVILEM